MRCGGWYKKKCEYGELGEESDKCLATQMQNNKIIIIITTTTVLPNWTKRMFKILAFSLLKHLLAWWIFCWFPCLWLLGTRLISSFISDATFNSTKSLLSSVYCYFTFFVELPIKILCTFYFWKFYFIVFTHTLYF